MSIFWKLKLILFYFGLFCFGLVFFGTVKFKNCENSYNQKFTEKESVAFTHTSLGPVLHLLLEWNSPSHRTKLSNINKGNPSNIFFRLNVWLLKINLFQFLNKNPCFLHLISRGTLPAKSLRKWPHCVYPALNDCCLAVSLKKTA